MSGTEWRENARKTLKVCYDCFNGTQWHQFDRDTETKYLKVKICFALFGPPTEENVKHVEEERNVEDAYNKKQRKRAQEIMDKILRLHSNSGVKELGVGFVFVACKQDEHEFPVPVFSVFVGVDGNGGDKRNFVDTQGRTYKDWDDWKNNNCLPKLEYCYPKFGYFTCNASGYYEFDADRDPVVEFGWSPQSSTTAAVLSVVDTTTTFTSFGTYVHDI
jgi:hypothetical protein